MKIKKYTEFVNEELNLKKALIGTTLAATMLSGCDQAEMDKRTTSDWHTTETPVKSVDPIELPQSFEMDEVFLTVGTDMNINANGKRIGKVEERTLSWGKTFEYFDNTDAKKATGKEKVFSLVTTIEIFDENNKKIGEFEEELLKSLFSFKTYYSLKDGNGNLLGESSKLDLFSTEIELTSPDGQSLCKIYRPAINFISDSWTVECSSNIDKRLVVFIPCYKTSADNERKKKEDDDN